MKDRIRSLRRLLKKPLDAAKKTVVEKELATLEAKLKEANRRQLESQMVKRYRKARFFDKRKLVRKIKHARKALEKAKSGGGASDLSAAERKLDALERDLVYVSYVPPSEHFIPLYGFKEESGSGAKQSQSQSQKPKPRKRMGKQERQLARLKAEIEAKEGKGKGKGKGDEKGKGKGEGAGAGKDLSDPAVREAELKRLREASFARFLSFARRGQESGDIGVTSFEKVLLAEIAAKHVGGGGGGLVSSPSPSSSSSGAGAAAAAAAAAAATVATTATSATIDNALHEALDDDQNEDEDDFFVTASGGDDGNGDEKDKAEEQRKEPHAGSKRKREADSSSSEQQGSESKSAKKDKKSKAKKKKGKKLDWSDPKKVAAKDKLKNRSRIFS